MSMALPYPSIPHSQGVIAFTAVKLPFGWLGNMAPFPIGEWRTSEHLFQASRFAAESPARERIRGQKSPMTAKMIAKQYTGEMIITPRSSQDLANMERVLALKLEQHPVLREALRATADRPIIEDCSRRANTSGLFWGAVLHDQTWRGHNHLGRLWMKLRSQLQSSESV